MHADTITAERSFKAAAPISTIYDVGILHTMAADILMAADYISVMAPLVEGQNERPTVARLATLMVEAIDAELSPEAWAVVNAAVRASVSGGVG